MLEYENVVSISGAEDIKVALSKHGRVAGYGHLASLDDGRSVAVESQSLNPYKMLLQQLLSLVLQRIRLYLRLSLR
jgi:hypothetical protein